MLVQKVISGGQTGADIAGLLAAKECGIPTGGTAAYKFMTENGPNPSLETLFGLKEQDTKFVDYKDRTIKNVLDSNGTIVFQEKESVGSIFTVKVCMRARKPYWINPSLGDILFFVGLHEISELNIAGNRESVSPGIQDRIYSLLLKAFKEDPLEE